MNQGETRAVGSAAQRRLSAFCIGITVLLFLGCENGQPRAPEQAVAEAPIHFQAVSHVVKSGVPKPQAVAIRSGKDWQLFWDDYQDLSGTASSAPSIDFDRQMVLAVFGGLSHGQCNVVRVSSLKSADAKPYLELTYAVQNNDNEWCLSGWSTPLALLVVERREEPVRMINSNG